METIPDDVEEETPPQSQMDNEAMSDEVGKQGLMSDASLRLMKMVDYLENSQRGGKADDDSSRAKNDDDNDVKNEVVGSADETNDLAKLEVDMSEAAPLSRMSTLDSNYELILEPTIEYHKSESTDQYEKSFQASKATLSSAMDFLKELDAPAEF